MEQKFSWMDAFRQFLEPGVCYSKHSFDQSNCLLRVRNESYDSFPIHHPFILPPNDGKLSI